MRLIQNDAIYNKVLLMMICCLPSPRRNRKFFFALLLVIRYAKSLYGVPFQVERIKAVTSEAVVG